MDCIDIGSMYLHPAFLVTMLVSLIAFWRMKVNVIKGYEDKLEKYPIWKKLLSDVLLPRELLTKRGKQWRFLAFVNGILTTFVLAGYIYFGSQDWVCKWAPENTPTDIIKNVFKDS